MTIIAASASAPRNGRNKFHTRYAETARIRKKKTYSGTLFVREVILLLYTEFVSNQQN